MYLFDAYGNEYMGHVKMINYLLDINGIITLNYY